MIPKRFLLAVSLVLATSTPARAQTPVTDSVSAQDFFRQGREAQARGDNEAAVRAFQESLRLEPAAGTLFNLAQCEERIGRTASAWQHVQEGLDRLPSEDSRRASAQAFAASLEKRVPRLRITLNKASSDAHVFRDGVELSTVSLGARLPVNPGKHTVVVRAAGYADWSTEVVLRESEERTIDVAPGRQEQQAHASSSSHIGTATWIAGGTAAAALATGLVTGGLALGRANAVHDHCVGDVCDPDGKHALEVGKTYGNVATVAFCAAGVAAAITVVTWIVHREPSRATIAAVEF